MLETWMSFLSIQIKLSSARGTTGPNAWTAPQSSVSISRRNREVSTKEGRGPCEGSLTPRFFAAAACLADILFYVLLAISVIIILLVVLMLVGVSFAWKGVSNCLTKVRVVVGPRPVLAGARMTASLPVFGGGTSGMWGGRCSGVASPYLRAKPRQRPGSSVVQHFGDAVIAEEPALTYSTRCIPRARDQKTPCLPILAMEPRSGHFWGIGGSICVCGCVLASSQIGLLVRDEISWADTYTWDW